MISRYTDILDLNNEGFDISFKMSYQGYENTSIFTLHVLYGHQMYSFESNIWNAGNLFILLSTLSKYLKA